MAVVINDFEVVPGENTSVQESGPTTASDGDVTSKPSAREIGLLIEQQLLREERVWAH